MSGVQLILRFSKFFILAIVAFSLGACKPEKRESVELELKPTFSETTVLSKTLKDPLQNIFNAANREAQLSSDVSGEVLGLGFAATNHEVDNKAYFDDFAVIPIQTELEYQRYLYSVLDSNMLDMMRFPHKRGEIEEQTLNKIKAIDFNQDILVVLSHPDGLSDYAETVKLANQADHWFLKVDIFSVEQTRSFFPDPQKAWVNNFYLIKRGAASKINMTINDNIKHEIVLYKNEPLDVEPKSTSETSAVE